MRSLVLPITATIFIGMPASAQPIPPRATGVTSRNDFRSEAEAKRHCGGRPVVWVVASERVYFVKGDPEYGRKGPGAYMCEDEARGDGNRGAGKRD
jgi:hypothetical protein